MNYSIEDTQYIVKEYQANPNRETVDRLAEELSRTVKSIIGKLSKEGVYRREVYTPKISTSTKIELVQEICDLIEIESLDGLEKTPKLTLMKLIKHLKL